MTTKTTTYSIQSKACFLRWGACSACVVARRLLLFFFLPVLLTACGHDDLVPPDVFVEEEPAPYVEIRIAVPLANPYGTRANPMGGEEGNGREPGILKEDIVHDINVFFYIEGKDESGKGLGMDSPDDTPIIKEMNIYYNLNSDTDGYNTPQVKVLEDNNPPDYWSKNYITLRFACSEEQLAKVKDSNGVNFVAIANLGPVDDFDTLGELRNLDFAKYKTNAWTTTLDAFSKNAEDMDYFLMSTAYNNTENGRYGTNKIEVSTSNNVTSYSGMTTLQRMYARLDLWYKKDQIRDIGEEGNKSMELDYQIKDKDKDETPLPHHVYITNVLPVNVMQSPSFLFKKVTNTPTDEWVSNKEFWNKDYLGSISSFSWGGKESTKEGIYTTPTNDRPTNYVIEPTTTKKEVGGGTVPNTLTSWYGTTKTAFVKDNIKDDANGKLLQYYHNQPASGSTVDLNHISIISYANENTHPTDCFHSNYLTGMAFRGVYVPEVIYSNYEKPAEGGTSTGLTVLSGDLSDGAKIYRYSPTSEYNGEIQGQNPELQLEKNSFYFSNEGAAEAYAKAHPGDMGIITAYDAIKHKVIDSDGKQVEVVGFICYYNLWLCHYNDVDDKDADGNSIKTNPHEHLPMEYATVRNNIYRVSVDFSGPGDPTPTMREPDTMKARIFVRKWNYREEDEIIF